MTDVKIKTPNLDRIFDQWKEKAAKTQKKAMEKQFGTKGSKFSLEAISAAESVLPPALKGAAIYFSIKKSVKASSIKEEDILPMDRLSRVQFFSFKKENVNKDNWRGKEEVPIFESIESKTCKECNGNGFIEEKCKRCKGTGKISEEWVVIEGEEQKKVKKALEHSCRECYGTGKVSYACKACGGYKSLYKFEILPVPFKSVVMGLPILHSSFQTRYEKEMSKDLQDLIEQVEGIKFKDFKELDDKAEASLGYWDKDVKKTVNAAGEDYKTFEKDENIKIIAPIYLFPMIQLNCKTKKGKRFEIYSIGSENNFMVYSNF